MSNELLEYYKILRVDEDASKDEIKRAYRKLVRTYHPDILGGDREKFKKIQEAYNKLCRKEIDFNKKRDKTEHNLNKKKVRLNLKSLFLSGIVGRFVKKMDSKSLEEVIIYSGNRFLRREALFLYDKKDYDKILQILFFVYGNDKNLKNRMIAKEILYKRLTGYDLKRCALYWDKGDIKARYLFVEFIYDNRIVGYKSFIRRRINKQPLFLKNKMMRYLEL